MKSEAPKPGTDCAPSDRIQSRSFDVGMVMVWDFCKCDWDVSKLWDSSDVHTILSLEFLPATLASSGDRIDEMFGRTRERNLYAPRKLRIDLTVVGGAHEDKAAILC